MIRNSLLIMSLCIFAGPSALHACTCSNAAPGACPGLKTSDIVFLGTVTDAAFVRPAKPAEGAESSTANATDAAAVPDANAPAAIPAMPVLRYHFHIDENLAGPAATDIDIFSGGDDGDCGYRFQKGAQYVVFTQQENDGQLYATICNGTRPASEGRAVMPQLRAMRDGKTFASVFGVLHRADPPFLGPPDPPADASADDPPGVSADADDYLPHVAIKLRSGDDRFQTSTDAHGVYSIYDVHAGEYSFSANLPPQMQLSQKSTPGELPPFTIPNGACYEYDVEALPTGHIQGSVLDPDGKPLPIASVELFRAGHYDDSRPGLWGFQGAKGVFDFDHVGPGEYVLVFNRTDKRDPNSPFPRAFYPGVGEIAAAKPIVLKDGQDLAGVNMKLANQYDSHELRVHLKWTGAKPPGGVTVSARASQGNNPSAEKIGDNLYRFTVLASATYTISAWEDLLPQRVRARRGAPVCAVPPRIETPEVPVNGSDMDAKEITLTFARPECGR